MTLIKAVILDDEPGITALCERLLNKEGFETTAFTEPAKALAYLRKKQADLLLVDIRMPVMSGFDVIVEVRQKQPDLAILVMTGYGTVETAIQALHEGVDGLLLKPFEKSELVNSVNRALDDKQKKRDSAQVRVLRPLFDVTESLLAETRSAQLAQLITAAASRLLQCPHTGLLQKNQTGEFDLVASQGNVTRAVDLSKVIEIAVKTDDSKSPILATQGGLGELEFQDLAATTGYGSILFLPIKRVNYQGVLFAARDLNTVPLRESDLEMSLIFSRQAAVALENARLYSELREYIIRIEDSQSALIQAEKLATAGRMTASMAHEINNPLQAVQNCLHLAAREDLPREMRQKYYEMTQSELERLMATVQRMLDFYRPNAERESVNVIDMIDNVLGLLATQLQTRGIRVTTAWPAKVSYVDAVGSQLQQVFMNIILNAFDAMPAGGDLMISIQQRHGKVEIEFQDNGPGVPSELQELIFEPFISTKAKGTGLGLSVSYGIIISHGGNLEFVPDRTPGACFRVSLPESKI